MAEAILGAVTGGFAVASLAIQLVEVAQKVYDLWDTFEATDSRINRIKEHLMLIQIISHSIIDICNQEPTISCGHEVLRSLRACQERTERLGEYVKKYNHNQDRNGPKRGWTTLKTTMKDKAIQKTESQLHGDVMMLLLMLQPFFHHVQCQKFASLSGRVSQLSSAKIIPPQEDDAAESHKALNSPKRSRQAGDAQLEHSMKPLHLNGRVELFQIHNGRVALSIESHTSMVRLLSALGVSLPSSWRAVLQNHPFALMYTSVTFPSRKMSPRPEDLLYSNTKRRLKLIVPLASFQIQSSSIPWSLTFYPIAPCRSRIFSLCADGNIDAVKSWLTKSRMSPFVVNKHGENLLHAAARYAHADMCNFLLDIGVDGSAYDDRLLTPLDHLAVKVCPTFAYPSRVVNTIRALVERGRCQPLLPLTSNAMAFYRGPEEGFAWLFASEYAGSDLEQYDSEGWTLLTDAAFNFGWWTQSCVEDPAVSWQTLYLLRAGADPHLRTTEGAMTPLDTFLRGSTAHCIDHARHWLEVLREVGLDLHKYADEEQRLHSPEQYLRNIWDDELWRWIPSKKRVVYRYGSNSSDLEIWLEDYDALTWFHCGRYDLEIFQICSAMDSKSRWIELNSRDIVSNDTEEEEDIAVDRTQKFSLRREIYNRIQSRWFSIFMFSLVLNYLFHLYLFHLQK